MMKNLAALLLVFGLVALGRTTMAQNERTYSQSQLQQMVAPIALYPDSLVSQILIASTYPIQVVEAYQWMQKNKALTGAQAQNAAKSQGWDPSVQSLIQFPQIVDRMFTGLEWTQDLGEAFLAQQQDVLSTIQAMRQKAYEAGNLKSTPKQNVVVQENTIVIAPAQPQVVYVPSYDPTVVYGSAWVPATWYYPPAVYAPPPGYTAAAGVVAFGAGVAVGAAWSSASNCSWSTGSVTVNNNYYHAGSGSYHGANGSVAHAGNTTAAYNANTGQVKTYNSATGNTRSGQVDQGARGTAVQGENGSAAHAGNTTATYNKNTGEAHTYNSATGQAKSGNVNNASASNWQHDSAQRQGQPYSNSSLNKQYGSGGQNSAAARGYGEGGGGQRPAGASGEGGRAEGFGGGGLGGGGGFESAASDRGSASRGAGGAGGGGFNRGGGGFNRGGGGFGGGGGRRR
jgi:hypothetical protein